MKQTKKLAKKSLGPGLFGPGVGPELPFTPGAIMDAKKEARAAAEAAAAAGDKSAVMPAPDDEAAMLAKRRQAARMRRGSGRLSTILADATLG